MKKKKKKGAENYEAQIQVNALPDYEQLQMQAPSKKELRRQKKHEKELESDRKREIAVMSKKTPEEVEFYKQIKIVEEECERDYAAKPAEVKKKGFKKLNENLKKISITQLTKEIQGYGFDYKASDYLKNIGLVMVGMVAASIFFGLKILPVAFLFLSIIVAFPIITSAQFEVISNNEDFEQIITYIEQMIISFKNNPKILLSMKESLPIIDGKMREKVQEAIHIIENDAKSPNVYQRAFAVIENEYKCSRIRRLHRFIYTVEQENSQNYGESLDNLYTDIKEWQKRTYKFQASLASTKTQLTILLAASIGIAGLFAYLMRTVEDSVTMPDKVTGEQVQVIHIIDNPVYQAATVIFFILFIIIYTVVNTKINGSWLVNDLENPRDREIIRTMKQVALLDPETSTKNRRIAIVIMVVPLLALAIIKRNALILVAALLFAVFVMKAGENSAKKKKNKVQNEIKQEFPLWMSDVAVSLKNRVVIRAVSETENSAAYIMRPFIRMFLNNVEKAPASIWPYMNFFGEYNSHELSTAIKTLYSIRTLSSEDSQRQVNDLIDRNQELLAESERIRQENSIAGVGFIGLLPMVLMSFLLMVYLVVMLLQFMALVGSVS